MELIFVRNRRTLHFLREMTGSLVCKIFLEGQEIVVESQYTIPGHVLITALELTRKRYSDFWESKYKENVRRRITFLLKRLTTNLSTAKVAPEGIKDTENFQLFINYYGGFPKYEYAVGDFNELTDLWHRLEAAKLRIEVVDMLIASL